MHSVSILLMVILLSFAIEKPRAQDEICANNCMTAFNRCQGMCGSTMDECLPCITGFSNCDAGCRKKRVLASRLAAGFITEKEDDNLPAFSLKKAVHDKEKRKWKTLFLGTKRRA